MSNAYYNIYMLVNREIELAFYYDGNRPRV